MTPSARSVQVNSPDDFYLMPQAYQDLLVHQLKAHTEGELSGADDYINIFYPMAPNVHEKRVCCERAMEELDHHAKGARVLFDIGVDVSYMLAQSLSERTLYATEAVRDIQTWEERGLFSFLAEAAVLEQLYELAESSYRPTAEAEANNHAATTPYWELLNIGEPWEIRTSRLDIMRSLLDFEVGWKESTALKCPECEKECPLHDLEVERKWRHVDGMRLLTVVRARVPRCRCPEHGVKAVRTPWSAAGLHYMEHHDRYLSNTLAQIGWSLLSTLLLRKEVQHLCSTATGVLRPIADTIRRPLIRRALWRIQAPVSRFTLPFDYDPPYKTYQCLGAHPLSILGAVSDLKELLASDYINFSCAKTPRSSGSFAAIVPWRPIGKFVLSGYCELLYSDEKLLFKISNARHVIQWLIDRIHDKWYLLAHVNKYYVPGTKWYLKSDFLHDCLIIGYDTEEHVFKVATYSAVGDYDVVSVPFACMAMALILRGSTHFSTSICRAPVILAVRPKTAMRIRFDRYAARKNLSDYLRSAPPHEAIYGCDDLGYAGDWVQAVGYPTLSRSYGLESFSTIISHIKVLVAKRIAIDMRDTRCLWEHKKTMYSNIEVWATHTSSSDVANLVQSYREVVKWAQTLHLVCFIYNQYNQENRCELALLLNESVEILRIEREILTLCYNSLAGGGHVQVSNFSGLAIVSGRC